jgi:UDP-N-acetylglucosamine--N-acetylmuramyl-(pentapeptide) pyrophosphoryl-undecaprenol N-acetylglucosamine transferase
MKERNFLMAGGGTGGHVIPGLAVARELHTRGHHVTFVGTEHGLEAKLVPAAGFDLQKIQIGGLNRVSLGQPLATLGRVPIATVSSDRCVRDASAVFNMGGYVAGPPVFLAAILRRVQSL